MRLQNGALGVLALLACCAVAQAAPGVADTPSPLKIEQAFARATPPGATSAGVYMAIDNSGAAADRLVGASSPVAADVAVHEMRMDNGIMKMSPAPAIEIKAHGSLLFTPGGYHVMLSGLRKPLKPGDSFPLQLTFEKAGRIDVSVNVGAMGATMPSRLAR